MLSKDFKTTLADRFEAWEIAEFLGISAEDFIEMFEDDIEANYEDVAEWIGLRTNGDNEFNDEEYTDSDYSER